MKWVICLALLGLSCDAEKVQPKVIKIDDHRYEVRYDKGKDLNEIAKAICSGEYVASPMGERSANQGGRIEVGIVRCIGGQDGIQNAER